MKKYSFILVSVLVMFLLSCKKDSKQAEDITSNKIISSQLRESSLLEQLKNEANSYSQSIKQIAPQVDLSNIDFTNAYVSAIEHEIGQGIAINLLSTDSKTVTFMLTKKDNSISVPTLLVIDDKSNINYYDLFSESILTLSIKNDKIQSTISTYASPNRSTHTTHPRKAKPCGQATADCISDAYSNHGWVSVWATIQSAIIPQTAVAIAAACAAKHCL